MMSYRSDKARKPNGGLPMRFGMAPLPKYGNAARELKDVLERKIEDLSRQLAEEKQASRQNKMSVSRLQRELTRAKSHDKPGKEQLSKELEHEKMLRVEAERRLHEMTKESESCRSRLEVLQGEFRKMEDLVRDMMQYKTKIDQLKQEKSSLCVTYENNIQKFKNHITDLERENMMLLNEVKKLESQINSKTDGRDRSKLLLERLRMLEGENSALVLENEQQRGQYEKCLDEIANQVVQALLAQKMLREECLKLQNRVRDLELHNRQLCVMFHQRLKKAAEATAQIGEAPQQDWFMPGSIESLQSMFSEQMSENVASMPQMSSPPPWLQERLPGDRHSLISFTGSVMSTPDFDFETPSQQNQYSCRTEIETEFPATPSSPKSKHVNVIERKRETKRSSSTSSLTSTSHGPSKPRTRSTSSLSRARGLSLISPKKLSHSHESGIQDGMLTNKLSDSNQGVSNSSELAKKQSSISLTNEGLDRTVPFNQSNPSISSQLSQEHVSRSVSKIPVHPSVAKTKDETQLRRNSLKAEYSIRMGCQSTVPKNNQSINTKASQLRPPSNPTSRPSSATSASVQGHSRSSSVTSTGSQGHSRSPSASSTGGQGHCRSPSTGQGQVAASKPSAGSRIPTVSKIGGVKLPKEGNSRQPITYSAKNSSPKENSSLQNRVKSERQSNNTQTKLVPPKSPTMRYSGIRTTLKNETGNRSVPNSKNESSNSASGDSRMKTSSPLISGKRTIQNKTGEISKPPLPVKGDKPVNHRTETHYPIMGLMNLSHTSPKNEGAEKIYANMVNVPSSFSSLNGVQNSENIYANCEQDENSAATKAQYFYDYSDEDSDFNHSMSKDFSVASTVSLDELLDETLENIETPLDGDFSTDFFSFNSTQGLIQLGKNSNYNNNNENKEKDDSLVTPTCENINKSNNVKRRVNNENSDTTGNNAKNEGGNKENEHRLRGKPDIVKDTEECEQRNLQKSLTISQIPGSSMPGYRAKRPKSLILGAKDKKFLYCEYGSSSSSDTSDDEWSYQFSYAKNIKQQEIQSKIAKSLKSGHAKVIETPKNENGSINFTALNASQNECSDEKQKTKELSQIPKPNVAKKPSKIPPPIANKPVRRKSYPSNTDNFTQRPKSVEICVNTVLSSANSKTCYGFLDKTVTKFVSKSESEKCLNLSGNENMSLKLENPEMTLNSTFEEVKVERSGSKDDGYSTMSSDVQPEQMEKYSDMLESSTNSNEIRNSNLSLSSQNSFSSEDRHSAQGSLGRVRAMKLKFDLDSHRSPEREIMSPIKSPPISPAKSLQTSPKPPVPEKLYLKLDKTGSAPSSYSKIPKPKMGVSSSKETVPNKPKTGIPLPKAVNSSISTGRNQDKKTVPVHSEILHKPNDISVEHHQCVIYSNANEKSPAITRPQGSLSPQNANIYPYQNAYCTPQTSTPKSIVEQFNQLSEFTPVLDPFAFLRDGSCDSNSSLSDRGSDLTSLHISEDNILSDIPEERDGYESSVGRRSENTSLSSLTALNSIKRTPQHTGHHSHSHSNHVMKFSTTLKRYWSSLQGLVRAASNADYEKQKHAKETADYEELYGGCLNIETLMERSSSESDIYSRGDKPSVELMPRLQRSQSADNLLLDDISIEEQVQNILKLNMMQQISKTIESADKDQKEFNSFVEMLIQKGHVMNDTKAALPERRAAKEENAQVLNKMAVSTFSSQEGNSCSTDYFASEEKRENETQDAITMATAQPVGEEQKKFNSQFYSLCNAGSNKSISDKSEIQTTDQKNLVGKVDRNNQSNLVHTCQKGDQDCRKCIEEKNRDDFDDISRQIENLSKTVNELHRSLSSLNSENSDSGSESNEGDSVLTSAIGNKDIDGYQWVEDEFFLSPYGGEIVLGGSPFSNTGASCDWMNEYSDNVGHFEELGGREALHEEPVQEIPVEFQKSAAKHRKIKPPQHSILAQSIDKEGNFDSCHFISRRLKQEEERRKFLKQNDNNMINNSPEFSSIMVDPQLQSIKQQKAIRKVKGHLQKEDLRTTPEKDIDDVELVNEKRKAEILESMLMHGGSQDSLDDNIGVDNVMCHRLLGGKGHNAAIRTVPNSRPSLDFSHSQFTRYSELEKQAVAAFDFLNEMSSSITSDQSKDPSTSHDQLFRMEENKLVTCGYRNQMTQSTTSNESRASPVKRNRRKLRPKIKKNGKSQEPKKCQKFSSTSADSNYDGSDDDLSFSDSCCGSYSSENGEEVNGNRRNVSKTMTYV